MAGIETTYRGHTISYGENSDEWYCADLDHGGNSHVSLAKLKAKIDKMYLDLRRKAAVKAFEISSGPYERPSLNEATVIEYVGQAKTYNSRAPGGGRYELGAHKVAVIATRHGNDRASRAEKEIQTLMPATPEAHAAFAEAIRLAEIARAAKTEADAALKAVPRLSLDDIAELVRIKETEGSPQ
ncbi:hypothetical protein NKJ26_03150 [Mesorhizobium sp. M0152]|uniref:hypothetical protein n=1 Tax=Mesorhizobium sp. M0152 TaxID=2956898 RepID=UPI00333B500A